MLDTIKTNDKYLNTLFSSKDFDFLTSTDKDLNELKNKIEIQEQKKEKIMVFFNKLKETFNSDITVLNKNEIKNIIEELEIVFKAIGDNINLLNNLEQFLTQLNQAVIELLVCIDSDSNNEKDYFDDIQNIKEKINNYSTQLNDANSKILLNDIKIDKFITSQTTQNYLNTFNINISASSNNSNIITKPDNTNIEKEIDITKHSEIAHTESNLLLVSEKLNKVFLPYKATEIKRYLTTYPDQYKSFEDVINKEFVLPLDYYIKRPVISRFREAYSLIRDREGKSIIEALKYSVDLMFKYELNPAIIAAYKTQEELENYINCLEANQLNNFNEFEIKFELNPI